MSVCSLDIVPKNKFYLTRNDFPSWNDYFGEIMENDVGRKYIKEMKEIYGSEEIINVNESELLAKTITLVVTERCNLRCTYCYEDHNYHKNGKRMTKEMGKKIIDTLFDEEKMKGYFKTRLSPGIILEFIGGEPLLEIDLIDYLVDYFRLKALEMKHPWAYYHAISISTNGVLYNTPKVQKFIEKNYGDGLSISITLDGNKKLHDSCRLFPNGDGSYDVVETSMKDAIQKGYVKQTKLTIAPANVKYTFEAIKNLMDLGLIEIYANCVYEEGWNIEYAKIFYYELKKLVDYIINNDLYKKHYISLFEETLGDVIKEDRNYCGGNGGMLAFDADGVAYPCLRFMAHSMSTKREPITVGDIDTKIGDNESGILKHLRSITMTSQSDKKCINCKISGGCGVCSGLQYDLFGDANIRATYICVMHQARVLANHYYFKKLYSKLSLNKTRELNIPKEWALKIIDINEFEYLLK